MSSTEGPRPFRLLVRFVAAVTLLYWAWVHVAPLYEQSLVPAASWLLERRMPAVSLDHDGTSPVVGVRDAGGHWRAFALQRSDEAYLSAAIVLAVVAALYHISLRRRLWWGATACAALWVSHVLILYGGASAALAAAGLAVGPGGDAVATPAAAALLGMWTAWGLPAAAAAGAILALPDRFWGQS